MSPDATTAQLIREAAELHVKLADLQRDAAVSDAIGAILSTHQLKDEKAARAIIGEMVRTNRVPASVHAANFLAIHPEHATDHQLTDEGKTARQAELRKLGVL